MAEMPKPPDDEAETETSQPEPPPAEPKPSNPEPPRRPNIIDISNAIRNSGIIEFWTPRPDQKESPPKADVEPPPSPQPETPLPDEQRKPLTSPPEVDWTQTRKPGKKRSGNATKPPPGLPSNRKPIDIWLVAGGAIVGIMIYLAPHKSPVVVVLALLAMFALAAHPIWNFWWIEKAPWRRIASEIVMVGALVSFGWYVWPHFFTARLNSFVQLKFPGPLLCSYSSDLGKTLAPTSIAINVEVVNLKPTKTRIYSYSANAVIETQSGTKTYRLHSVPISGCEMYFVAGDWTKAKKIDFSSNDFDLRAREVLLGEGESLSGWMLFELDPTVRGLDYNIKEIHLTIEDTVRDRETISLMAGEAQQLDGGSILSSGEWKLMAGYYDFSKEHYTLTPQMDLQDALKRHKEHPENYPPSPPPP